MLRQSLALAIVVALPVVASAHGLDMALRVAEGSLIVILTYDDDSPCEGATVRVLNAANEVVARGTSDTKGVCVVPVPPPGDYVVRAHTEDAHAVKQPLNIPADRPPPEVTSARPPRLLYLGLGLLGLTVGFNIWYWLTRKTKESSASA